MSVSVSIQGTIIDFPTSGQSPDWSDAVVLFAQSVEHALQSVVGDFDVFPQIFILTNNANTNLNIPNLNFPIADVRSAYIRYSVYRSTATNSSFDSGDMTVTYDSLAGAWTLTRGPITSNSDTAVTFNITAGGQIQITTTSLSGTGYSGRIGYTAQALKQT